MGALSLRCELGLHHPRSPKQVSKSLSKLLKAVSLAFSSVKAEGSQEEKDEP